MTTEEEACQECKQKAPWHLTSCKLPSPEQTHVENEKICERLLGWKRYIKESNGFATVQAWIVDGKKENAIATPTFLTGNDMLLILEAFAKLPSDEKPRIGQRMAGDWYCACRNFGAVGATPAEAVRAAALAWCEEAK